MLLGQARGRVGSVVFSRREGKQITRAYNPEPSNPQTRAQALQRAQFATVIAASVGFKEVINNSFDGTKNGQQSVNEFVSRNLQDLRARALDGDVAALEWLVPKGQSFVQPQSWMISRGQLGQVLPDLVNIFGDSAEYEYDNGDEYRGFTVANFKKLYAYEPGCQMTFVTVELTTDVNGQNVYTPRYDRIVFNSLAPSGDNEAVAIHEDGVAGIAIDATYIDKTKTTLPVVTNYGQAPEVVMMPDYITVGDGAVPAQLAAGFICLGIITTVVRDGKYVHTTSYIRPNFDGYDYTEDAVSTYLSQTSNARKVISSDYYTEQPVTEQNYVDIPTLNEVVSATIKGEGMTEKGVYVGQSNSYGPVAEGAIVTLLVNVPARFQITSGSISAYNGETPLGNDWQIQRFSANYVQISGPMPTTASFPFNVSFRVWDTINGTNIGTAALRINVSKANA